MQVLLVNNNKFASEQMLKQSFHSGACSANRRLADDGNASSASRARKPCVAIGKQRGEIVRKEGRFVRLNRPKFRKNCAAADAVWHSKRKVAVVDRLAEHILSECGCIRHRITVYVIVKISEDVLIVA